MKQLYLDPARNYKEVYVNDGMDIGGEWIKVPDGAEIAIKFKNDDSDYGVIFYKDDGKANAYKGNNFKWAFNSSWTMCQLLNENYNEGGFDLTHWVLWQRAKQPESLPFVDDEVTAWETQVGGNHYKDYAIQPMEFALANKLDFAQGNVIKYVLRHDKKNGREDLEKAKHYIDLMIAHYYGDEK
jgi:hypothetical protein